MSDNKAQSRIVSALRASQTHSDGVADLQKNGITSEEEIEIVCKYIISQRASTLRTLLLGSILNENGGEMIFIAFTLSQYCKLQFLSLAWTGIGSINSMRALAEYLISPSSSHLSELDLSGNNKIGDNEVKILCSALFRNSTLSSLHLSHCDIGNRGAFMLQYLFSNYNSTLSTISLKSGNQIDGDIQIRISEIKKKYDAYNRICHIIDYSSQTNSLTSSSSSSPSPGNVGDILSIEHNIHNRSCSGIQISLSDSQFQNILSLLNYILKPLPPWKSINNNNNRDSIYDVKSITIMSERDDLLRSMIISLNRSRNSNCSILNITSIDEFKWKILFICSIINSVT